MVSDSVGNGFSNLRECRSMLSDLPCLSASADMSERLNGAEFQSMDMASEQSCDAAWAAAASGKHGVEYQQCEPDLLPVMGILVSIAVLH